MAKVNITLSADEDVVRRTREYATEHGTTLNQLVRDYMESLTGKMTNEEAADSFVRIATEHPGRSEPGYRFDRDEAHRRDL